MPGYTDPEELLTHVSDDDTQVLGPVARRLVHGNPALIHRSVHILIVHPDTGHLLLQKRSLSKDTYPGRWDTSVGGHVNFGQSYEQAAVREIEEELGVTVDGTDLEKLHLLRFRDAQESENTTTYLCFHTGPFIPNPEEVTGIRWWTRREIEEAIAARTSGGPETFTPHFEEEFAIFVGGPRGDLLR